MTPLSPSIRDAARSLRRRPGYAGVVMLVLSLGLGATIAVFTVLDALVLRPLPLREPGQLVSVWIKPPPDAQWDKETVGIELVDLWRARATSFAGLAAFVPRDSAWLPPQGPERVASGRVVGDLFSVARRAHGVWPRVRARANRAAVIPLAVTRSAATPPPPSPQC